MTRKPLMLGEDATEKDRAEFRRRIAENAARGETEIHADYVPTPDGPVLDLHAIEPLSEQQWQVLGPSFVQAGEDAQKRSEAAARNRLNASKPRRNRQHPRKAEALEIAQGIREQFPGLTAENVAMRTIARMGSEDVPVARTITKWMKEVGL
jgi:hypothetical protein